MDDKLARQLAAGHLRDALAQIAKFNPQPSSDPTPDQDNTGIAYRAQQSARDALAAVELLKPEGSQ